MILASKGYINSGNPFDRPVEWAPFLTKHGPLCTLPPPGWACFRGDGHTGFCAAIPVCECCKSGFSFLNAVGLSRCSFHEASYHLFRAIHEYYEKGHHELD